MTLITGTWKLNLSGFEGTLILESIAQNGKVSGQLSLQNLSGPFKERKLTGMFDATSRKIQFYTHIQGQTYNGSPMLYSGFLFPSPARSEPGQDLLWTIVGTLDIADIELTEYLNGNARRMQFGWFATIEQNV